MMSQSQRRVSLRGDFENPPIAETTEGRIKNSMDYCQPPRNWPLVEAAQKADVSVWTLRR